MKNPPSIARIKTISIINCSTGKISWTTTNNKPSFGFDDTNIIRPEIKGIYNFYKVENEGVIQSVHLIHESIECDFYFPYTYDYTKLCSLNITENLIVDDPCYLRLKNIFDINLYELITNKNEETLISFTDETGSQTGITTRTGHAQNELKEMDDAIYELKEIKYNGKKIGFRIVFF